MSSHVRARSFYYENANREFRKIADYGVDSFDFSFIGDQFQRWFDAYGRGKYVVLKHKNEDKWLFILQVNRFQQAYKERLKESLKWLHFVKFETSLTLTIDPKRFALLHHEYIFIGKGWRKLHNWLVHKYGKFFYVLVLEVTKKGRPHLHILTTMPYMDISAVREKWVKYGGGQQMHIDNLHENFNAVGYVLKYVTKTIAKSVEDNNAYSALLFASNKRLFSINDVRNRSMLDFHHRASANSESKYEIEGSVPLGVVGALCREMGIDVEDFVLIEPNDDVLQLFPDVFNVYHDNFGGGG